MQIGGQTLQIQMIPMVEAFQGKNFLCQRAAGNQQNAVLRGGR